LPTSVTEYVRRTSGLPVFTWTVRTPKQRRIAETWADAMIFEGFTP
ncbi:MAG TPA: glycerophosphodiester phosphodiesterase, partial [Hyphomicrobium sp.]|nr:glycerophosphodiester phosphodiesterase [Hyphomicrobium sp.]